ncbi:hypothetical protein FOA52_001262 [Chlamydomonas sp. UWO 241]|nr:hypothetical protein FOA52_001262 [Chlamydomonas sp. UWO 241]
MAEAQDLDLAPASPSESTPTASSVQLDQSSSARLSQLGSSPSTVASTAKLFLGGLSWGTDEGMLRAYFSKYGEIEDVVVMRDRLTQNPRGFGFVTFKDAEMAAAACRQTHSIDGRTIDAKPSVPRSQSEKPRSKKIFVGGLAPDCSEEAFCKYFAKFGVVEEATIMFDHNNNRSRGFGFVTFEEEDSVNDIFKTGTMHMLGGKQVEVKSATPKGSGPMAMQSGRGGMPGMLNPMHPMGGAMAMGGGAVGGGFGGGGVPGVMGGSGGRSMSAGGLGGGGGPMGGHGHGRGGYDAAAAAYAHMAAYGGAMGGHAGGGGGFGYAGAPGGPSPYALYGSYGMQAYGGYPGVLMGYGGQGYGAGGSGPGLSPGSSGVGHAGHALAAAYGGYYTGVGGPAPAHFGAGGGAPGQHTPPSDSGSAHSHPPAHAYPRYQQQQHAYASHGGGGDARDGSGRGGGRRASQQHQMHQMHQAAMERQAAQQVQQPAAPTVHGGEAAGVPAPMPMPMPVAVAAAQAHPQPPQLPPQQ